MVTGGETRQGASPVTSWGLAGQLARLGSVHHNAEMAADAPPNEAPPRIKATCLWARFRHFLASCWAGTRLRALCQYRPGASSSQEHDLI